MIIHCSNCSNNKRKDSGEIPALDRYLSQRLQQLATNARAIGSEFYILSGRYGLIHQSTPIPWYDHLLQTEEVAQLAEKVVQQIQAGNVSEIRYFSFGVDTDEKLSPYLECIRLSAEKANIPLYLETATGHD